MLLNKKSINHLYQFEDDLVCLPFEKIGLINKALLLKSLKHKGNNEKKVLVLVSHSIHDLDSKDNILLFNILKAIKLTLNDIVLIEYTSTSIQYLWRVFDIEKCISIGLNAKQIGFQSNFVQYSIFNIRNIAFMMSESAEVLNNHKKHKEKLWISLKKMFSIQ